MRFHYMTLWIAALGLVAVVLVTIAIADPMVRLLLVVISITPLIYMMIRIAFESERRLEKERRRYTRLRTATDEFLTNVRNLNRLKTGEEPEGAPVDVDDEIDDVIDRMHNLVERMREEAGVESGGSSPGTGPGGTERR